MAGNARLRLFLRAVIGAALLGWLANRTAWTAAGAGVGLSLPPTFMLFAVPVVSLVSMVPVTIHGLGMREGVWTLLLVPLGSDAAAGVALGLLYFAAFALVGGAGGVWLALRGTALAPDDSSGRSRGASAPPAPDLRVTRRP